MRDFSKLKNAGRVSIGLILAGCTNRPFYLIGVLPDRSFGRHYRGSVIEQVGVFDPLPNVRNEKLVAFNFERIKYWIGEREAHISVPLLELLGISGFFPIHPKTFIRAKTYREEAALASQSSQSDSNQNSEESTSKQSNPSEEKCSISQH